MSKIIKTGKIHIDPRETIKCQGCETQFCEITIIRTKRIEDHTNAIYKYYTMCPICKCEILYKENREYYDNDHGYVGGFF